MKSIYFLLFCVYYFIKIELTNLVDGQAFNLTIPQILQDCSDAFSNEEDCRDCSEKPYCFGFLTQNAIANEEIIGDPTNDPCFMRPSPIRCKNNTFVSISHHPFNHTSSSVIKIILVGKSGLVGIIIGNNTNTNILKGGKLAVICLPGDNPIQILTEPIDDFKIDNRHLLQDENDRKAIFSASVDLKNSNTTLVCEFYLNKDSLQKISGINLSVGKYKIGFFGSDRSYSVTAHQQELEPEPTAPDEVTSSKEPLIFFQKFFPENNSNSMFCKSNLMILLTNLWVVVIVNYF